jgi:hypothetical protein
MQHNDTKYNDTQQNKPDLNGADENVIQLNNNRLNAIRERGTQQKSTQRNVIPETVKNVTLSITKTLCNYGSLSWVWLCQMLLCWMSQHHNKC